MFTRDALVAGVAIALTSTACQPTAQEAGRLSEEDVASIRDFFEVHRQNALASDWAAVFILYQHPQVYAEVGLLQVAELFPRAEYYSYLRRLVDAGFGDRILFGSDGSLREGIDAILEADFLTEDQKQDILCDNAARFLRLDETICR